MVKTDAKNSRRLGREKAVVSPSFTTTAPFRGPELVNRLELVYVLSYLVFLFTIFSFISVLFRFNSLMTMYIWAFIFLLTFKAPVVTRFWSCLLGKGAPRYRFLIIIIIPMITRVLFSLRLFSTTGAESGTSWQPSYYLAEEWWEVL